VDRVFLDANVLFSASYREESGLLRLWLLADTELVTSYYAWNEARRNIDTQSQLDRLSRLAVIVKVPIWTQVQLPEGISVAEKDRPILLDAINSRATHLLTGDKQHFGALYGQKIGGVLIQPPADYLASRPAFGESRPEQSQA
jgi:predicted nucleic acid-binding protein